MACGRRSCSGRYPCSNCEARTRRAINEEGEFRPSRADNHNKTAYGRGSTSGAYGRSSYNFESATFDGLPALKRRLGDKVEFFYGENAAGEIDVNDRAHGHAVLRNGRLVYKRLPGQEHPVVNRD